jgi:hypothetical protein
MNALTDLNLHSAYDDLSRLLAVVADPAKHKARLDELVAKEKAAKEKIEMLNAMEADTRRLHSTAIATNIVSDNRKTALDTREAELEALGSRLEQSAARHSDAALRHRENAVEAKEEALKREAERLAATRKELDARVVKINNALR